MRQITDTLRLAFLALLALPASASGQYRVVSPAGDSITLETERVKVMLDTTRALRKDLEEDPRVMYALGFGERATERDEDPAWPWNAVSVQSDSVVQVITPGNLREADRAYENYSVMRMRVIRGKDPDASCDSLIAWEAQAVSSFVDGWIVARTLFGGPPYAPLDALAFARVEGHLPALIVDLGNRQVGACAGEWAESHPEAIDAYRTWYERQFPEPEQQPEEILPESESTAPLEATVETES
ncbi:MAG: hypothetical protein M8835_12065 [marine benthic group bacterium]|nr:hypothetical protein [Gemmatimonadota bacterium]MCL7975278.1 hypothetical protein [Gemmatimonadota bacterium]